ncbi:YebC/PmpR family DNA-binding transcriptional regulator [Patescibacteria group bacterium]|nr:YebC/PmpR family DNA-binding transcriptional regulator [Patescibacteria group bacterium]
MSGHSKWATTHRQKAIIDAKRGAVFTKFANLITIAAKKGADPEANPALRAAIDRAKSLSMPKDNIERAIKRGTGELAGDQVEELYYEGLIPPNIQIVVKCLTDNKNRSGASVRHIFTKNNGAFGSVLWNFEQKGVIQIDNEDFKISGLDPEKLELELIDAGISDFIKEEDGFVIQTELSDLQKIKDLLESKNLKIGSAEIEYVAKEKIKLDNTESEKLDKIFSEFEENEDVSDYYSNVI